MHWLELLEGVRLFNDGGNEAPSYEEVRSTLESIGWDFREGCPQAVAEALVSFVTKGGFKVRGYARGTESIQRIQTALAEITPLLRQFRGLRFGIVDLSSRLSGKQTKTIAETAGDLLQRLSEGPRRETTAASKILHVLLPEFFVMWDRRIQSGYAIELSEPRKAYCLFLKRVGREGLEAARTCARENSILGESLEAAIRCLEQQSLCHHPFSKLLDEYNFMKFTRSADTLWSFDPLGGRSG